MLVACSPSSLGAAGVAFGYCVLLPRAIHFLTNYDTEHFRHPDPGEGVLHVRRHGPRRDGRDLPDAARDPRARRARRPQLADAAQATAGSATSSPRRSRSRFPGRIRDDVPRAAADVAALRGVDLARGALRAAQRRRSPQPRLLWAPDGTGSGQGEAGRQQAKAQTAAKPRARGAAQAQRRRQSEPGALLHRACAARQKWVFLAARDHLRVSFVGLGVGSGTAAGSTSSTTASSAAAAAARSRRRRTRSRRIPRRATAISPPRTSTKSDTASAISALQPYLASRRQDAAAWARARRARADAGGRLRDAVPAGAAGGAGRGDPSAPFLPGGTLGTAVGPNPIDADASQQAASRTSTLYQKAVGAYGAAPSPTTRRRRSYAPAQPTAYLQELAQRGAERRQQQGRRPRRCSAYLKLYPNAPQAKQIRSRSRRCSRAADGQLEQRRH